MANRQYVFESPYVVVYKEGLEVTRFDFLALTPHFNTLTDTEKFMLFYGFTQSVGDYKTQQVSEGKIGLVVAMKERYDTVKKGEKIRIRTELKSSGDTLTEAQLVKGFIKKNGRNPNEKELKAIHNFFINNL